MLKDLKRLADSVNDAGLSGLSDDVSAGVGQLAEYAGQAVTILGRSTAQLDRTAAAHEAAADAVRDLALLAAAALGLVLIVWGGRQAKSLWG